MKKSVKRLLLVLIVVAVTVFGIQFLVFDGFNGKEEKNIVVLNKDNDADSLDNLTSNELEVVSDTQEYEAENLDSEESVTEETEMSVSEETEVVKPETEEPEAEENEDEPETEEAEAEEFVAGESEEEDIADKEYEIEQPKEEEPVAEETVTEEPVKEEPTPEELPEVVYTVTDMDTVMHAIKACKIYTEPSVDYDKLGSLVADQAIRVTGITDTGWYQVEFCGKPGYIATDLIKEQEIAPEPTPSPSVNFNITSMDAVMFSTCDSLIFNAPDTASGVMGSLVRDQAIRVTGQTDTGWYQVEFCGNSGYMTMDMLTATARVKARNEYTEAELIQMCLAECVTPGMSDWDKAIAINNYLVDFCEYDYSYSHYSTYDALTHGIVVCQGYANAYKKLMEAAGVKTDYISGQGWTGREWGSHGWNRVTIDGQYYYVDVTWNDSMRGNYYLLLDYDAFHYDHYQQRVNPYRIE